MVARESSLTFSWCAASQAAPRVAKGRSASLIESTKEIPEDLEGFYPDKFPEDEKKEGEGDDKKEKGDKKDKKGKKGKGKGKGKR